MPSPLRIGPFLGWLVVALPLVGGVHAQGSVLFEAGKLWTRATGPGAVPRALAFAGEALWEARSGATPGVTLLSTAHGPATPLAEVDPGVLQGALGPIEVRAGSALRDSFLLARFASAVPGARRARVMAVDPTMASGAVTLAPRWTHELGPRNGPAHLGVSANGEAVLVAAHDAVALEVVLERLAPEDGTVLWTRSWRAGGLTGPLVADDGERIVLSTGAEVRCLDGGGATLWSRSVSTSSTALALAGDGRTWAHGEGSEVLVWRETAGTVARLLTRAGDAGELPVLSSLDRNGTGLAIVWWRAASGTDVRFEWLDTSDGARLAHHEQSGGAPGLQNYPSALALSADGEEAALGLWGADDERPELVVFARGVPEPHLALDLGASVEALVIDSTHRVAVAQRSDHANRLSVGGSMHLWETEPHDLVLLGAPRPGGTLGVALRLAPGHRTGLAVVGLPLATPLASTAGALWLERRPAPIRLGLAAVSTDRLEAHLAIPATSALFGLELGVQAVRFGVGGPRIVPDVLRFHLL